MIGLARLPAMRARAESRMLDTFTINTSATTYSGGVETETLTPVLTGVMGRVKVIAAVPHSSEVGGRTSVSVTRELHIPVSSAAVPANAVAVCTAVHATSDPTLLNARLRLSGPAPGSQTTARRLQVTEALT